MAIHSEVIGYKHSLKCNNCAYGILLYPVGKASIFFRITWIYISIYLLEMGTTSTFWYDQLLNPRNTVSAESWNDLLKPSAFYV